MAQDNTKLVIEIEQILKGLDKTLKGLGATKKALESVASVKLNQQTATANEKAAVAAQKLSLQQQKLVVQAQELANRQEKARQVTERLALSQQKLANVQQQVASTLGKQSDAHVRFFKATQSSLAKAPPVDAHVRAFRAIERASVDADSHVRAFRASEAALRKAPQLDAHVRAFKAIQKGAEDANHHVRVFRAQQAALAKAPQLDAHVQAFRAIETNTRRANQEMERARKSVQSLEQALGKAGNTLRNIGQGLASFGTTLSVALTAPIVALGALSTKNAVELDSLKRGLTAIVGSANEAGKQLSRLTEIAKLPGIGFQEAIQGSIRLQAVGFSASVAEKALREFANAVALTGGGRDELTRITVQLGQLSAKGRVLSQDLRPIIEAGPAVGRALKEAFGTVNAEDIQALGLSSEEFLDNLLKQLETLPRAAAGARNTFENFSDVVFRASAAIGEGILPALTAVIEFIEPIVTRLATAFGKLPTVVQTTIVLFGGLVAAIGPTAFIMGQLISSVGSMITAFARLSALGLTPTIQGFQLLSQVMRGTAGLAAGQAATTAAAATGWIALGGAITAAVAVLAVAGIAIASYVSEQNKAVKISEEQIKAQEEQIASLRSQVQFIDSLGTGVGRTAAEQDKLREIYESLNIQAQTRITGITEEEKRLAALRLELEKIIKLRQQERVQQAASLAGSLADTLAQIDANEKEIGSITSRVQANAQLSESLQATAEITAENRRRLAEQGITANTNAEAIGALNAESENLVRAQTDLRAATNELNGTATEQATTLRILERQTGLTARELLTAAKNMGVFRGDVEQTILRLERYTEKTKDATKATDDFNRSLSENERQLNKAGQRADAAAKQRRELIQSAAAVARETSVNFEGALKSLREMVDAVPELRAAFARERELTGKSLDELLRTALESAFTGREKSKAGTGLRNAQEQLAQALAELAQSSAEQQATIERLKNERLLQINENNFKLQLIAYREYLNERARLTSANIGIEINAQKAIAADAIAEQKRLAERAAQTGLPKPERTKAEAGAKAAEEKAIKAGTRILELQQQQRDLVTEVSQLLAESAQQQQKDVRQLDGEFAELTDRIEDALNVDTVERFREELLKLGKEQERINRELEVARLVRDAADVEQLERASRLNQSQIDLIEGIVAQEQATNRLTVAQRFIEQAREKQAQLEQQITFEVENRGLTEEEAIRRRLEGEQKLADRLRLSRDIIQDTVNALNAQGVKPPQALLDFIREVNAEVRGLGELPFSEQFRLVEKEFNRLNDERIRRIQDVERAVRNRDIAEIEGAILIRRINGEYTAALEQQLELLKRIAEASGSPELRRQATDAGEVVKDTRDEVAGLSKQIESAGKDAFRSGLTDFFNDILNRTATAKEAFLNFVNSIAQSINDVIAQKLSKELFESIFGGAENQTRGLIAAAKRLFGFGGPGAGGTGNVVATGATEAAKTVEATTAAASLTAGAATASAALATGGATAAATLATSITAAAASFSAAVVAAGAAFAAAVTASAGAQAASLGASGIGSFAVGDILQPREGGVIARLAEGGYPEAVLTTDPRYAGRQAGILREYLQRTKGLFGRIPGFAAGGFVTRHEAEMDLLGSIHRAPRSIAQFPETALAGGGRGGPLTIRQIFVDDQRDISNWYNSAEGDQVQIEWLARNRPRVRKLLGVRD